MSQATETKTQIRFSGSEEWMTIAPYRGATEAECAAHAIYLHGLRHARNVRQVRSGVYRGLIGRRVSPMVYARTALA